MSQVAWGVLCLSVYLLLRPSFAHAYLDPGTGSYIIQVAIGFVVGGLYLVKIYWKKLAGFFARIFLKKDK